jgi:hypothetical protein
MPLKCKRVALCEGQPPAPLGPQSMDSDKSQVPGIEAQSPGPEARSVMARSPSIYFYSCIGHS